MSDIIVKDKDTNLYVNESAEKRAKGFRWFSVILSNVASAMAFFPSLVGYTFLMYAISALLIYRTSVVLDDRPLAFHGMFQFVIFFVVTTRWLFFP